MREHMTPSSSGWPDRPCDEPALEQREREHVVLERRRLVNAGARNEGLSSFSVPQLGSGKVVVAGRMRWVTAAAAASEASGSHMS